MSSPNLRNLDQEQLERAAVVLWNNKYNDNLTIKGFRRMKK